MHYFIIISFLIYLFRSFFGKKGFSFSTNSRRNSYERPKDFEASLLVLASVIIKADGVINQTELDYVRMYFVNNYGKEKANKAFSQFRVVMQERISVRQTCGEISQFMPNAARIQLVKFLFGVAYSDGEVSKGEELEIRRIASYMMLREQDYYRLQSMYYQEKRSNYRRSSSHYSQKSDYEYETLGISENATNDEIKKAYRTLAKKYHPDRLQGATKEAKQVAKEKFQKIQSAYEKVKGTRRF